MLAASYAKERGLNVVGMLPEFGRWPDAVAVEKRDADLVALADAAVFVCADREPGVLRLFGLVKARAVPVHVIGEERPAKAKPVEPSPEPEMLRVLPD